MSHSQRSSPKGKERRRPFKNHYSEDANHYNKHQTHHTQYFHSTQQPYTASNAPQPQQYYNHKQHKNHQKQYYNHNPSPSPFSPFSPIHNNHSHNHTPHSHNNNAHVHTQSLMQMGQSTPNIRFHSPHSNQPNRHSNPPQHNLQSLVHNTQPHINLSKADIFNHPNSNSIQAHTQNRYVATPSQHTIKTRSRARTYTPNTNQSPQFDPDECNANYSIPTYTPHSHTSNMSNMSNITPFSHNSTPHSQTPHMQPMTRDRSHTYNSSHNGGYHTQNVTFSQLSHSMPNASPMISRNHSLDIYTPHNNNSGYHNPQSNALPPQSPNMSPSVSLDQYNRIMKSSTKTLQGSFEMNNRNSRGRGRHEMNNNSANNSRSFYEYKTSAHSHNEYREHSPLDSGNDIQNHPRMHISTGTNMSFYHMPSNTGSTPSSDSSNYLLEDDMNNLREYQSHHTQQSSRASAKSAKSNKSRSSQKSKRRKKKAHKTHEKRERQRKGATKGRQAVWGQSQNKYFKKKSSHKKLLQNHINYKKSEQTKKFLRKRIKKELLFENLPEGMVAKMVKKMYRVDIPPNMNVVCCGDTADAYFVIEKGKLEIWKPYSHSDDEEDSGDDETNKKDKLVLKDTLNPGDTFGDNALLYATTHQYTYRASATHMSQFEGCRCWALSQETFDNIRKKQASSRLESSSKLIKFVKSIAMFADLLWEDLQEISDAMMRLTYKKQDKIVCEGDSSTHFFIIYRGTCHAYKSDDAHEIIMSYKVGDCFGELGIMKAQNRAATVRVTSETLVAYALPANDFKQLLDYDVIKQNMNHKIDAYKQISDDCKSFENRVKCKLSEFKEIGVLGVGAFGRVTLVEDPFEHCVYALKKVRKNRIVETSQQEHIINEKRIMVALDTQFCIRLFATFKDALNVYFLLEPVMGGELFSLLRHEKRLKQRHAMFYCACVVLAFDYMHTQLNVMYRDLKPENLLISNNGYCKLVDFGFAKKRNNTCTLCGTPQYLAPEVIQNFAHGFAVDWWSVGILIYEMLFGYPPFEGDKNMKMYEKILTAPVEFPSEPMLKPSAKDIINSLLRKQAHKRLGAGTKGADQIKKHPFFKRMDWPKMFKQELDPPWKPRIKGNYDLSAFDRFPDTTPENEQLIHDPDGDLFKWCDEF